MEQTSEQLRTAMRYWATGITIVTAAFDGIKHGMTVSSFTSVSLEPAQVLVSLAQNTRTHDLIMRSRGFGINLLASDQKEISDKFAGRIADEENRLSQIGTFKLKSNTPFIQGGLAYLDCKVITTIGSGTHTIFIGEVLEVAVNEAPGDPLIYFNRKYRTLSD